MDRVERLRERLAGYDCDAALLTNRSDIAWLSGFRGSSGGLLVTADEAILVTDFRYRTQAAEQAVGWRYVEQRQQQGLAAALAEQAQETACEAVAFQSDQVTYQVWEKLAELLGQDALRPVAGLLAPLREVKDAAEIAAIRRAAAIADAVMAHAWEFVRPGLTERELKAELEQFMLHQGAEGPSFDMILAGGPHSALPHAPVTDRPLARGDLLTIDLGARYQGYCSDLTRTCAIGGCTPAQEDVYRIVLDAQLAAIEVIRPGVTGREVDQVARDIIAAAGHGDAFGHGLGHGVGLDIHEAPRLAGSGDRELAPGMVVTVEPGIYLPEFGGVRIEDLALVTATGCELLSAADKPASLRVV